MSDTTPNDLSARVTVLEEIASATKQILADKRIEMRESRAEMRDLRAEHRNGYRWLLGIMPGGYATLLGVMAHGFHWI